MDFTLLPTDIKKYVLRPLLDLASFFSLRCALFLYEPKEEDFTEELQESIISSKLDLVKIFWSWLNKDTLCSYACKAGNMEVLTYCVDQGLPLNEVCCIEAAKNDRIDILTYLKSKGWCGGINLFVSLIQNDKFAILQYLIKNNLTERVNLRDVVNLLISKNSTEHMVKYISFVRKELSEY